MASTEETQPVVTGPPAYPQQYEYGNVAGGYPPQPGYGAIIVTSPGQPQPQQTSFVQPAPSYVGHIAFACVVLWCCNWVFGLIAFILAGEYSFVRSFVRYSFTVYKGKVLPRVGSGAHLGVLSVSTRVTF